MKLVRVPDHGPGLFLDEVDRFGVEPRELARIVESAPQLHGARAPLLERGVVEKRVGVGVHDLVGERRRRHALFHHAADVAALDAVENPLQSLEIHRLVETVRNGLVHQRMVRNPDGPFEVLGAGRLIGKHRREKVVGAHPLNRRRHFLPAAEPWNGERAAEVPAPARGEHRRREEGLGEHRLRGMGLHESRHDLERKRVLLAQGNDDSVVGRGRLELEVEGAAEPLPEREPPGPVDARAERRVDHELHPAGLVEEALDDDGLERRHSAERALSRLDVFDELLRPAAAESRALGQCEESVLAADSRSNG